MAKDQPAPVHIALIPDGNRRWAKREGRSTIEGHQAGAGRIKPLVLHAASAGVRYVTLWGLSLDNFTRRSPGEVAVLLELFRTEFERLATDTQIHERQTRIIALGEWPARFPAPVRRSIERAQTATQTYTAHTLTFLLAYNGTTEMLHAAQALVEAGRREPQLVVTPALLKQRLYTHDLPAVDLVIRTGGEPHLSTGFMMWDTADAMLYFTETLWPEFSPAELDVALAVYHQRQQRGGK